VPFAPPVLAQAVSNAASAKINHWFTLTFIKLTISFPFTFTTTQKNALTREFPKQSRRTIA
jgi:hypothetical protein